MWHFSLAKTLYESCIIAKSSFLKVLYKWPVKLGAMENIQCISHDAVGQNLSQMQIKEVHHTVPGFLWPYVTPLETRGRGGNVLCGIKAQFIRAQNSKTENREEEQFNFLSKCGSALLYLLKHCILIKMKAFTCKCLIKIVFFRVSISFSMTTFTCTQYYSYWPQYWSILVTLLLM